MIIKPRKKGFWFRSGQLISSILNAEFFGNGFLWSFGIH
ncbi:conserved hypothetical protein [delta proteobacterium NaphS2]|nr:conserved hypothetical protein [delta proteobacterium NaphS2]